MTEEDAERLLEDLRMLEPLLDGGPDGICGGKKVFATALLRAMSGVKTAEPRQAHSVKSLAFAVRGCFEDSNQRELLVRVMAQCGILDAREAAMKALWSRGHEAIAELKDEMDKYRRRSS